MGLSICQMKSDGSNQFVKELNHFLIHIRDKISYSTVVLLQSNSSILVADPWSCKACNDVTNPVRLRIGRSSNPGRFPLGKSSNGDVLRCFGSCMRGSKKSSCFSWDRTLT